MADNEKETSVKMALHVVCWRGVFMGIKDVLTRNFQSDTPVKKLVREYIRGGECKLTETVQNN